MMQVMDNAMQRTRKYSLDQYLGCAYLDQIVSPKLKTELFADDYNTFPTADGLLKCESFDPLFLEGSDSDSLSLDGSDRESTNDVFSVDVKNSLMAYLLTPPPSPEQFQQPPPDMSFNVKAEDEDVFAQASSPMVAVPISAHGLRRSRRSSTQRNTRRRSLRASPLHDASSDTMSEASPAPPTKARRARKGRVSEFLNTVKALLADGHPCLEYLKEGEPDFYVVDAQQLAQLWTMQRDGHVKPGEDGNSCHSLFCYYARKGRLQCFKQRFGSRIRNVYRFI